MAIQKTARETLSIRGGVKLILQAGAGKAGALSTAFQDAPTPYVAVMDGDGSYVPSDVDRFLPSLARHDFIKCVRNWRESVSRTRRFGHYFITTTFNILFGTNIGDVCFGKYVLRTGKANDLHMKKHPLTVKKEIAAEMTLSSSPIMAAPVHYRKRAGGASKMKTRRQGFRIFTLI